MSFRRSNIFLFAYHSLTAKVVISNIAVSAALPFRKSQIIINTWHGGGAYKKVGLDEPYRFYRNFSINLTSRETTYFLSSSREFTRAAVSAFNIDTCKIVRCGMPRNDIFFGDYREISRRVYEFYHIKEDEGTGIVLYAPTFRGSINQAAGMYLSNENAGKIIEALNTRFDRKHLLMVRAHYSVAAAARWKENSMLDGNIYDDTQELLCAADILITDYSSITWDFCLTKKPFFLYTPDSKEYAGDRGFYIPIEHWGFPLAGSCDDLLKNIGEFDDEQHRINVENHLIKLGSYENGSARQACVDLIERACKTW